MSHRVLFDYLVDLAMIVWHLLSSSLSNSTALELSSVRIEG